MNRQSLSIQTRIKIVLLVTSVAILVAFPFPLPARLGAIDFRPYWTASFLCAHGQDFSNPSIVDKAERELTDWREPFTMYAWFGPTGVLMLLPYTLFPFSRATYYWLLTNIAIVFFSALLIWRGTTSHPWIPLAAAFGFSMTLLSLIFGQVNTLVVLGLALFLYFSGLSRNPAAGASLALTTVKPHLVILTLPLLLCDIVRRKEWRIFTGFLGTLVGCALAMFLCYPAWPSSYWRLLAFGLNTVRGTPTVSGLLMVAGEHTWGKWIWVAGLLIAIAIWWKRGKTWERRTLIDASVLAGVMIAPFGWSYDQIVLLFPLLRLLGWVADGSLARTDAISVTLVLLIINAITFYQRILTTNEVWFFWVPLVVAMVYTFAWQRRQAKLPALQSNVASRTD